MKRILTIGFYGALIGIVIGIAVVCGMWILSDSSKYFLPYSENFLGKEGIRLYSRAELSNTAVEIDPYYIDIDLELGKEGEIVFGHIQVGNINRAIKFFNSINKLSVKWDILFQLENKIKHNIDQRLQLALITIEFIQTVMPTGENEKRRDLLILIGNDYLEIGNKKQAKIAFNEAEEFHNKIKQNEESSKSQEPPYSTKLKPLSISNSERYFVDSINQTTISLGKIILFPLLFGAVGFILSVILKPALEAFGRAIIAPAIAKKIGSNEMIKELNIKEK